MEGSSCDRRVWARKRLSAVGRGYAWALSMLFVVGLATGCAVVVGGSVRPAPGLVPRALTGRVVAQALLDSAELARAFGQSFKSDPNQPGATGGRELLQGNAQTPPECGGVVNLLLKDTYVGSDVREVAANNWMYSGPNPAAITVHEAVVALPTAQAADAQFAAVAQQWSRCNGASMTVGGDPNFTSRVGTIQEKDSVLATPVDDISSYMTMPEARAVGVRVNCIVEVKVIYYGRQDRDKPDHRTPTAADIAHLLMHKVSSLA